MIKISQLHYKNYTHKLSTKQYIKSTIKLIYIFNKFKFEFELNQQATSLSRIMLRYFKPVFAL